MTHATRFAAVAVLVALVLLSVSCEARTSESDALRVRAGAGDAEAQFLLGSMYSTGEGLPLGHADDTEAMRLLLLAADQGYAAAQYRLGGKYSTGADVPLDLVQAHMWYSLAASRWNREANRMTLTGQDWVVGDRNILEGQLTPAALNEAQRFALEWELAHLREP
jgi:TPR repeat protein